MSGKFVIPYTNIGGGFGIAGICGTSTEAGSLVLSSMALYLLCRDIISGRTCNEVTFLRFVVLTSCQLFSVDAVPSSSSLWDEALREGGVRANVRDVLAEHDVCCWFCMGRTAVFIGLED